MAYKKCTKCGHSVGTRTLECPMCGNQFVKVAKLQKELHGVKIKDMIEVNWKTLKKNDLIMVFGRSGPYCKTSKGYVFIGEKRGVYKVRSLDCNGIHARPMKSKKGGGNRFIYMGPYEEGYDVIRSPHHIKKIISC